MYYINRDHVQYLRGTSDLHKSLLQFPTVPLEDTTIIVAAILIFCSLKKPNSRNFSTWAPTTQNQCYI